MKANKHGIWQHHQVDRMLRNVKYAGKIYYAGKTYDAEWKPIIDTEIFEEAQRSRGIRGKRYAYRGNNFERFFLLGVLRCGVCDIIFSMLKDVMYNRQVSVKDAKQEKKNSIDIVEDRKNKILAELTRAKHAYLKGVFELAEYGDIKSKLEQELKELSEIDINEESQRQEKQDKLMDKISNVLEAMDSTDNANEKRKYLQQIIKEIRISPGNIEFIYNI